MSDVAVEFLSTLARTTVWMILAGFSTAAVLRLRRANWPIAHRVGWVVTLVVGWTFLRMPVAIPWYDAAPSGAEAIADATLAPPPMISPLPTPSPLVGEGGDGHRREALVGEPGEGVLVAVAFQKSPPSPVLSNPRLSRFDWPLAVAFVWALGMVVLAVAWLIGYVRFVRSMPSGLPAERAWLDQWGKLLLASGVRRSIPLRVTTDLGPMLCRLPRGYELLVPEALWRELEIGQRGAILRHELAHYLRGDVWKSLAVRVLALPHWFNPVSWWAVRRFEEAAEWACDRAATAEEPPTTYAKALIRLGAATAGPAAYGSAARGPALAVRIRRLVTSPTTEDSTMKKTLLVGTGLCLAALSLVRLQLVAKEPAPEPPAEAVELNSSDSDPQVSAPPASTEPAHPAAPLPEAIQVELRKRTLPILMRPKTPQMSAASQKMVEQAQKAYEATVPAYEAETATLEAVCEWSLRWMAAAEGVASEDKLKIAAVSAHLERMRNVQKKAEALYQIGSKGGEAKEMATANFYVAEAERLLAQVAGQDGPGGVKDAEMQILDLEIKIAELEGQLKETEVQLRAALDRSSKMRKLGSAVPEGDLRQLQEESAKLQVHRESLRKQLGLYTSKLQLYERASSMSELVAKPATTSAPAKATAPGPPAWAQPRSRPDKATIRYNGQDFDAWAEELRDDLSPERRTDAIQALAAFGANGYGPQAAAQIIEAMRGYSVWMIDASAEGKLKSAAIEAFKKIPRGNAMPVVTKALKSDDANQRLFALVVLPSLIAPEKDALPLYREALKDENFQVRAWAMACIGRIDPKLPELQPALREALAADDQGLVISAIQIVGGRHFGNLQPRAPSSPARPELVPELVGLLNNPDNQIKSAAISALLEMGPEVIPALEKAWQSTDDEEIAKKAEETLLRIRKRLSKQPR
ncbi:MAG: HEAT repeat domain-containing protein [Planctomycetia bacterium]|nr:HEAT repeat domain-containing protein [Planctomycetia bacterium]